LLFFQISFSKLKDSKETLFLWKKIKIVNFYNFNVHGNLKEEESEQNSTFSNSHGRYIVNDFTSDFFLKQQLAVKLSAEKASA